MITRSNTGSWVGVGVGSGGVGTGVTVGGTAVEFGVGTTVLVAEGVGATVGVAMGVGDGDGLEVGAEVAVRSTAGASLPETPGGRASEIRPRAPLFGAASAE